MKTAKKGDKEWDAYLKARAAHDQEMAAHAKAKKKKEPR